MRKTVAMVAVPLDSQDIGKMFEDSFPLGTEFCSSLFLMKDPAGPAVVIALGDKRGHYTFLSPDSAEEIATQLITLAREQRALADELGVVIPDAEGVIPVGPDHDKTQH